MAATRLNILKLVTKHMTYKSREIKYTKKFILKDARKFNQISRWRKSGGSYTAARRLNILKLATKHMIDGRSK